MHIGQHRVKPIPFWRSFLIMCCVLALPACSDRRDEAAQSAFTAQQAYEAGDLQTARNAINEAILARDDVADYHLLRGRIELALNSQGGAYNAFSNALALDATNGQALLGVAELGLTTGHLRESLEATERILTLAPDNRDALLVRGIHSIIKRDYSEAIEYGDKILAIAPGHEAGTVLKARALFMSRRADEALQTLDEISGEASESVAAALTRLEIFRTSRRPDQMAAEFARLRELRPDDLALRADEANLRFKMDDRRQAHALIAGILSDSDTDAGTAELALSLWEEYGVADVPADVLPRIARSGSVPARRALARFLIRQGRAAEANVVLSSIPGNTKGGLTARYLLLAGTDDEGLQLALRVLDQDATDCDALIAASEGSLGKAMPEDGLRFAQVAASECPDQVGSWLANARAYEALGRASGANRAYVQALDANKQSGELTRAYTRWLVSEGRTREAVAMARRLTRYAPALMSGWRHYLDLCRRFQPSCAASAERGLDEARTLLGVDLPPGTSPPNGLFGRLIER